MQNNLKLYHHCLLQLQQLYNEIAVGVFGIISAFIAVMNVVVKINSTLAKLESAVIQLKETMENQSDKNNHFYTELAEHEKRILVLEREWGAKI